jgi:plastocyanin
MLGVTPTTVWWRSNVFEDLSATVTVNPGDHVAFERQGTARRIYVEGTVVASDSAGGFNHSSTETAYIGGVSGDGRFGYRGKVGALRGTRAARFGGSSFTPPTSFPNP